MEIMGDLQLDFSGNKSFCIFVWEQCNSGTDCTASEEIASCKVVQIPESGKFLLLESGIRNPESKFQ